MSTHIERSGTGRRGLFIATIEAERPDLIRASADDMWIDSDGRLHLRHHNAYVNTGLDNALDLEWGLGGTAIGHIGVDNNSSAVTATTVYLHGAAGATAANQIIKAISPAATRSGQTTTGGATFANADFTSGVFVINKIGLLNTATDAGTGLIDVIGGTGGSSPFNRTFVLDLTSAGIFSATLQVAVTATAV